MLQQSAAFAQSFILKKFCTYEYMISRNQDRAYNRKNWPIFSYTHTVAASPVDGDVLFDTLAPGFTINLVSDDVV
jgi:hypothetical protein